MNQPYPKLLNVRSHKHTCANVQIGSTYADKCDCGALDSAGEPIDVPASPQPSAPEGEIEPVQKLHELEVVATAWKFYDKHCVDLKFSPDAWHVEHGHLTDIEPLVRLSEASTLLRSQADTIAARDARIAELEAAIDSIETSHGLTNNGNLWRFWSHKAQEVATKLSAAEARLSQAEEILMPFAEDEGEAEYKCRYCGDYAHNAHRCRAGSHDFEPTGGEVHTFDAEPIRAAAAFLKDQTP